MIMHKEHRAEAPRPSRRLTTALCILLFVAGTACNDRNDVEGHDSAAGTTAGDATGAAPGDSARAQRGGTDTLGTPAPAPADLAADTIPLVAPDGGMTRYGIKSGRIVQRFTGNARGTRTLYFDKYGMLERREEAVVPYPEGKKGLLHNVIIINTPEQQTYVDVRTRRGQTKPNTALEHYISAGAGKTKSLGEIVMEESKAERLPDTTIAGYRCRVLRKNVRDMIVTNWMWRGIVLKEHFLIPKDSLEYSLVPVEISPNVDVPDSMFKFSDTYTITPFKPRGK